MLAQSHRPRRSPGSSHVWQESLSRSFDQRPGECAFPHSVPAVLRQEIGELSQSAASERDGFSEVQARELWSLVSKPQPAVEFSCGDYPRFYLLLLTTRECSQKGHVEAFRVFLVQSLDTQSVHHLLRCHSPLAFDCQGLLSGRLLRA